MKWLYQVNTVAVVLTYYAYLIDVWYLIMNRLMFSYLLLTHNWYKINILLTYILKLPYLFNWKWFYCDLYKSVFFLSGIQWTNKLHSTIFLYHRSVTPRNTRIEMTKHFIRWDVHTQRYQMYIVVLFIISFKTLAWKMKFK